jgi:hypothetical protein
MLRLVAGSSLLFGQTLALLFGICRLLALDFLPRAQLLCALQPFSLGLFDPGTLSRLYAC